LSFPLTGKLWFQKSLALLASFRSSSNRNLWAISNKFLLAFIPQDDNFLILTSAHSISVVKVFQFPGANATPLQASFQYYLFSQ